MAGEITDGFSIAYDDGLQNASLALANRLLTSAGKRVTKLIQNVGTSQEALQMGEITAPGAFALVNLDPTNFIDVKVATSGAIFARLKPDTLGNGTGGWVAGDCLGSGAQAPFAIADTATCRMAVLICDA